MFTPRYDILKLHDIEVKGKRPENIAGCISMGNAALFMICLESFGQSPATTTFGSIAATAGILAGYYESRRNRAHDRLDELQAFRLTEMEILYESDNGVEKSRRPDDTQGK